MDTVKGNSQRGIYARFLQEKPLFFRYQKTLLGQQLVGAPLYNSRHFVPYVTAAKASLPLAWVLVFRLIVVVFRARRRVGNREFNRDAGRRIRGCGADIRRVKPG